MSRNDDRRDPQLDRFIDEWKAATQQPPAGLEARILAAVRAAVEADAFYPQAAVAADSSETPTNVIAWPWPSTWSPPVWAAAGALAATLAIGSFLGFRSVTYIAAPDQAERLLVADALRDAEAAGREHARAIARLEQAARPILASAHDPSLSAVEAGRLMSFRNRLQFLDQTIAEIKDFLEENPGHAGARTMLLAAYAEKTDVLRDVVALEQETTS